MSGAAFEHNQIVMNLSIDFAQHRPHVTQFVKHCDGFWLNTEYNDLHDSVQVRSVEAEILLAAIYRGITFPAPKVSLSETERN